MVEVKSLLAGVMLGAASASSFFLLHNRKPPVEAGAPDASIAIADAAPAVSNITPDAAAPASRPQPVAVDAALANSPPPIATPPTSVLGSSASEAEKLKAFFMDTLGDGSARIIDLSSEVRLNDMFGLQARVEQEPRDEVWASAQERELERHFDRQPFGRAYGSLLNVKCASSVCRVELVVDKKVLDAVGDPYGAFPSSYWNVAGSPDGAAFEDQGGVVGWFGGPPDRVGTVFFSNEKKIVELATLRS
ncbi:MAG: hypothetical protein ACOZAA_07640 [Pseudomonadota bacterium]